MNKNKIPHSSPFFDADDEKELVSALRDRYVSSGGRAEKLGRLGAELLGKKWGFPTQSGTDALTSAFYLLGVKENDRVAVPAYICSAVLDALAVFRAVPAPVDIEKETLALSPELVNVEKNIKAVIAAHLFGIPASLEKIKNKNLIEDCAQTLAFKNSEGVPAGESGRISICSFYATKLLTTGHGGLIAGNEEKLRLRAENLFSHDKQKKWFPHFHFLMSDLNAALGIAQILKIRSFIAERRKIAGRFTKALTGSGKIADSIFSRFLIAVMGHGIEKMILKFEDFGIEAKRPVFKPLYRYLGKKDREFPNSKWAHDHIVSVPLYPGMNENEIQIIEEFLEKNRNEVCCWPPV